MNVLVSQVYYELASYSNHRSQLIKAPFTERFGCEFGEIFNFDPHRIENKQNPNQLRRGKVFRFIFLVQI